MNELNQHLGEMKPGMVADSAELARLLAARRDQFDGSDEGGMEGHKLLGRMEDVTWTPPVLVFVIERHGGTVCGSTRAELQHWAVDLDARTATITKTGHRQLKAMAPRISIKALADELAGLILAQQEDERLHWQEDGEVQVRARRLYPDGSGFKRTVEGRRMRLCRHIEEILVAGGWLKKGWNVFKRTEDKTGDTPAKETA